MLGLKLCFFAEFWDLQDKKCSIFCLRNLSSGLLFDELIKKTDDMKGKYDWLDLIRGLAALAVFIGHLRVICFSDVPFTHLDLFGKLIFFLTGFGHISVIIFFVLSGFLIIKSIDGSVERRHWSTADYAQNRLFRLWVVLIPCLFLGLILDKVGMEYWGGSLFYSGHWKYFINQDLASLLTPRIFIGNIFFLQNILVPTLGSNGALWSLANEFWYYAIFPLFYFGCINYYNSKLRVCFFATGILLLLFVGYDISMRFPIWLFGGLSYIITKKVMITVLKDRRGLFAVVTLFLASVFLSRIKFHEEVFNFYLIAFLFSLSIPFLVHAEMKSKILNVISTYLSNISYTLYLAHLPFIYLVTAMFNFQNKEWNINNFWIYTMISAATVIYSALLWFLFERNTNKIRKWLTSRKRKEMGSRNAIME